MIARRTAQGSVAAAAVAVVGALWALVHWGGGSPGPALVVSVVACLVGFALALVAEAFGSDRRDLRIGLAGLVGNAVIAAGWAFVVVAALIGS
jgi:4-amino-4-deoxy-L-arabinose transferase-like glycosyltransferase